LLPDVNIFISTPNTSKPLQHSFSQPCCAASWSAVSREVEVKTETDIAQLLEAGNGHRAVAAHNLNDASSRSHAIFTLTLEQRRKPNAPPDSKAPKFLKSKLHLVDLAGIRFQHHPGCTLLPTLHCRKMHHKGKVDAAC